MSESKALLAKVTRETAPPVRVSPGHCCGDRVGPVIHSRLKHRHKVHQRKFDNGFSLYEQEALMRILYAITEGVERGLTRDEVIAFLRGELGILDADALSSLYAHFHTRPLKQKAEISEKGACGYHYCSFENMIRCLYILMRGSRGEQARLAFDLFDFDRNGLIQRGVEMATYVKPMLIHPFSSIGGGAEESPEGVKHRQEGFKTHCAILLNIIAPRVANSRVWPDAFTREEFVSQVTDDPMLLTCLFDWLPDPRNLRAFENVLLSENIVNFQHDRRPFVY